MSVVWEADNRYNRLLINRLVQDFSDAELAEIMDYWFIFSVTAKQRYIDMMFKTIYFI